MPTVFSFQPGCSSYTAWAEPKCSDSSGGVSTVWPSILYPTQTRIVSNPSSTSSLVTHNEEQLLCTMERRRATASNQPQRRRRPVTEPNSWPTRDRCSPNSSNNSVGNGPAPTRVAYALTMPKTSCNRRGPKPVPAAAPPAVVVDEVTNGYVPRSTSNIAPWAPSNSTLRPSTLNCSRMPVTSATNGFRRSPSSRFDSSTC